MNTWIKYQAYFDQFVTNGFYPTIVQPCRFTKKTGCVIDHTFCKLSENTSKSYSGILISNMSDHLPHFTCLDILSNQLKPPKYIIKEKHDEASLLSFYNEIDSSLRNTHFPNELTTDPNLTYNQLENNPQHKNITIKTFLKEKITFSFGFSLLEQETVFKIISKINSKHSCGHDDVSTILMKNICRLILSPITLILNQSLSTGILPDRLKITKIIPLFKKRKLT